MAQERPTVGTLDATDTASTVTLGDGASGEIATIVFQITGTPGGAFDAIVRGTLTDPTDSPTWFTMGFVKADAPGTVVTATGTGAGAAGIYKVQAEGCTQLQLKTNTAGTGSLPILAHAVRG